MPFPPGPITIHIASIPHSGEAAPATSLDLDAPRFLSKMTDVSLPADEPVTLCPVASKDPVCPRPQSGAARAVQFRVPEFSCMSNGGCPETVVSHQQI